MLRMRKWIMGIQVILAMLPVGMSMLAIQKGSWLLAFAAVGAIFAVTAILPVCRRRESMWIFFLAFLTLTPLDIYAIVRMLSSEIFAGGFLITQIFRGGLLFLILFSLEQLLCGLLARFIWKRQLKAEFTKD